MIKLSILNQFTQIEFMPNIIIIKKVSDKNAELSTPYNRRFDEQIMFIMEFWLIKLFSFISIIV